MTSNVSLLVRRARWTVAGVIVILAAVLIAHTHLTSGSAHRAARYMIMGVWSIAEIAIPVLVALDLLGHVVVAGVKASQRQFKAAGRILGWTILADTMLCALTLAAAWAVLEHV